MEYATRDQAQSAINTLSNQNLMGRLVYVREVWRLSSLYYVRTGKVVPNAGTMGNLSARPCRHGDLEQHVTGQKMDLHCSWNLVQVVG